MKQINKISKQIEQITAPVRQISEAASKIMTPIIERFGEMMTPVVKNINEIAKSFEPFLSQIHAISLQIAKAAEKWQVARKQDVALMAENGWYPNWFTFFYTPSKESNTLDELMVMHLNDNWNEITSKIIEFCPTRNHILENAFDLHKSGNYIAAMPLFLSQADGICCESLVKSFLFTGNEVENNINKLVDSGQIKTDIFTEIFLEPFKIKNHHNAGVSKSSQSAKSKAPSRNGILHGHRKHLDYGTEINSLKCFSLLSFIVYSTKDLMQEKT
jgi:hypothetical protein